jgi:general secretion pathway protein J
LDQAAPPASGPFDIVAALADHMQITRRHRPHADKSRRRDPRGAPGFTLIEVLVAVTLLGLLMVAVSAAVRFGAQSWRRAEQQSAATADVAAVEDVLRRMIITAKPRFASADPTDAAIAFNGEANSLALIGTLPDAFAPGLQGQQRLFLVPSGATQILVVAWRLDLPASDGGELRETLVPLLDHVRAVRFAYYGPTDDGSTRAWTDTWSNRHILPALVRVHIERDTGSMASWPDLIASPMSTVSNECRYTGLDSGCHRTP